MSTNGSWIYEIGSSTPGTGGGGGEPTNPAPAAIIDRSEVREIYNGQMEARVYWHKPAAATALNFKGVAVYLEDPDISAQPNAPMDGSIKLDGSTQLSGNWKPTRESDVTQSPAVLRIPAQADERFIRVYLVSFGNTANATPYRANQANPSPSIQITVPAGAQFYASGQEYAWLITDAGVDVLPDFNNALGPQYSLLFHFTEPDPAIPLPPGMNPYGGVQIVYDYEDGNRGQGPALMARRPDTWIGGPYPAVTGAFVVYFCSQDDAGRVNSVVPGVTPAVEVHIVYPPPGQTGAPSITGLNISPTRWAWQPDGSIYAMADLTWTPPAGPDAQRYAHTNFYRTDVVPPVLMGSAGGLIHQLTLATLEWPRQQENWTITAISVDQSGREVDDPKHPSNASPSKTWVIGPPVTGDAPLGTAGTVTYEQELTSDGVVRVRFKITGWTNPSDNKFGGMSIARVYQNDFVHATWWDAALNQTSYTTDWEPAPSARLWDFYFVSRDPQGNKNSILPGTTPVYSVNFSPMAGQVIATRMPAGWWSEDEFSWPSYPANDGQFIIDQIVAGKVFVGSILRVGGGTQTGVTNPSFKGQENGQIAVYNADQPANHLVAWMGQQGSGAQAIYGGWFKELYVGGSGPPTAPIYANNAGAVMIGGIAAGDPYPYVSVRRSDGVEVGRIGALLGQGIVPSNDPAYIGGAWFNEFAVGGQSLADWRILSRRNPTAGAGDDLVNIRNINKFQIDYAINAGNGPLGVHPNAPYTLLMGSDIYGADSPDPAFWKFPGLSLYRTNTANQPGHGIAIVNRGIILNVDAPTGTQRRASLVTWNGDQQGRDNPNTFWAELTMYSPTTANPNVFLRSGYPGTGSAYLKLTDGNVSAVVTTLLEVTDQYVATRSGLAVIGLQGNIQAIDGSAQFVGPAVAMFKTGNSIYCPSYYAWNPDTNSGQLIINQTAQWVGKEILANGNIQTTGVYVVSGGYFGKDYTVTIGGVTLYFKGGILYDHS